MTDQTAVDRIPIARSVVYAVRGLPDVPNQYGPGVLVPGEITLTYRGAPDSQLGRVHAYVAGRIWVAGKETPLLPGGLYGQHYFDGLDGWPEWLAEEARLHDPDASAVPAGHAPATDQAALRARLVSALDTAFQTFVSPLSDAGVGLELSEHLADAVLSVLPAPADRAATEERAARWETAALKAGREVDRNALRVYMAVADDEQAGLRRMADEAQQPAMPDVDTLAAALDGLHTLIATSSRDWQTYRVDAWLWAVLCGWDCEQAEHDDTCTHGALEETAAMHGWDDATVAKARRYRAAVRILTGPVVEAQQPEARS